VYRHFFFFRALQLDFFLLPFGAPSRPTLGLPCPSFLQNKNPQGVCPGESSSSFYFSFPIFPERSPLPPPHFSCLFSDFVVSMREVVCFLLLLISRTSLHDILFSPPFFFSVCFGIPCGLFIFVDGTLFIILRQSSSTPFTCSTSQIHSLLSAATRVYLIFLSREDRPVLSPPTLFRLSTGP